MAEHKRSTAESKSKQKLGTGVYSARVVSHLDTAFMGGLEVTLLKSQGNQVGNDTQTYPVQYAPPFLGYTTFESMGQNTCDKSSTIDAYNDTQKSYGMWFVPPDVGVTVLVIFVDGDASQGYWFACVPSKFVNNMVPAIAGSESIDMDKSDKTAYDTKMALPVAEINRRLNAKDQIPDATKIKRPLHPMAAYFLEEGLIEDDVRGVVTSSARRNAPGMVFGISSPGPLDKRAGAKKARVGSNEHQSPGPVPVSRLGGSQFVMDDGDETWVREKPASSGPKKYVEVNKGGKGTATIPKDEYFRLRTRTGHQILLHNSEDLIYIGNSRGTSWIELTSNGKIDVYAADSVSVHSENDINVRADRDVNLEAGRNINIAAGGAIYSESVGDTNLLIGANGRISSISNFELRTGSNNNFTAGAATNIKSGGNHVETAAQIHNNGPAAATASAVKAIPKFSNPVVSTSQPWAKQRYQDKLGVSSIMKRIPMHEPWSKHENLDPAAVTPTKTDREKK